MKQIRRKIAAASYSLWVRFLYFLHPARRRREDLIAHIMDGPGSTPFYTVETMHPTGEEVDLD